MRRESHAPFCERLAAKYRRPTHQLVGDFKNGGRELRPKGKPEPVRVHDFAIPELGKAVPYGIYDVSANAGFVNVGISADTGEFSVASIRRWWYDDRRAALSGCQEDTDQRRLWRQQRRAPAPVEA